MRAKEFVINIPLTININTDGELSIDHDNTEQDDETKTMVPPLQQDIEIKKATLGKESQVISDLLHDEEDNQ